MDAADVEEAAPDGSLPQDCPTRVLMDQLADKWSLCVLLALADGPVRFNELKRVVEGVTQKMLGQTLRRLDANGLVERRAFATRPMRVEYEVTPLGRTLLPIIEDLRAWSVVHYASVVEARRNFERRTTSERAEVA